MIPRHLTLPILLIATLALSGCAFTPATVELGYSPQPGVEALRRARGIQVYVEVTDAREDTSRVSNKINSFRMDTASIHAEEPIEKTLKQAIETELKNQGFSLADTTAGTLKVTGAIGEFYSRYVYRTWTISAVSELALTVAVISDSGETLYSTDLHVEGEEPGLHYALPKYAGLALNDALSKGMNELFKNEGFMTALLTIPR